MRESKALPPVGCESLVLLIIPTLNEEKAIGPLLAEARQVFRRIIVVDGHSTDRTREIGRSLGAAVILQQFGPGKGCGVKTGMKYFLSQKNEILCVIDGDGSNIPSHLIPLVEAVKTKEADIAIGSRTIGKRDAGSMGLMTLASNRIVSLMLSLRYGGRFTDIQTGYWAFSRPAVERILPHLRSSRFEIELEVFAKARSLGLTIREIPVGFRRRIGRTKFSFPLRMRNLYFAFRYALTLNPRKDLATTQG